MAAASLDGECSQSVQAALKRRDPSVGELDQSPTPAQAKELLAKHPEVQGHFYAGAGHGFNCDQRGSYNAEAAKLARERTLAFFRKHLG